MSKVTIYHNPRCSKSRQTLQLLQEQGVDPTVIEYLKTPLKAADVVALAKKLKDEGQSLLRKKEAEYSESGLTTDSDLATIAAAIEKYPKLLERPVVVGPKGAAIGRPPEAVLAVI